MWPRLEVLHWTHRQILVCILKFRVCEHGMPCALEIIHGGSKQEHVDLAPQQQQTSYLNYHNAYGHQTWQDVDLS